MTLLEKNGPGSNSLLSYYVCLQKGEVLYADGEFEFALMYFHRANQLKASQPTCLDGIRKATEILRCTICQKNVQLTVKNKNEDEQRQPTQRAELLPRVPIRRASATIDSPLTRYTEREANRLLIQVAKDRKLLIDLSKENQSSLGWTKREKEEKCDRNFHLGFNGLAKAQLEARGAIAIIESQLKFLDQAECLGVNPFNQRLDLNCSADFDRGTLLRMAEDELKYLQELSLKDKSMEVKTRTSIFTSSADSLPSDENRPLSPIVRFGRSSGPADARRGVSVHRAIVSRNPPFRSELRLFPSGFRADRRAERAVVSLSRHVRLRAEFNFEKELFRGDRTFPSSERRNDERARTNVSPLGDQPVLFADERTRKGETRRSSGLGLRFGLDGRPSRARRRKSARRNLSRAEGFLSRRRIFSTRRTNERSTRRFNAERRYPNGKSAKRRSSVAELHLANVNAVSEPLRALSK